MRFNVADFVKDTSLKSKTLKMVDDQRYAKYFGSIFDVLVTSFPEHKKNLALVELFVRRSVYDKSLPFVWSHGDLNAGNVFFDDSSCELVGIIDWDNAAEEGLPFHDLLHFFLSTYQFQENKGIGYAICELLEERVLGDSANKLIEQYFQIMALSDEDYLPLVIIYWARHIAWHCKYTATWKQTRWVNDNYFLPLNKIKCIIKTK